MKTKDVKLFLKYIALSIVIVYFVVNFVSQIYSALEANYFFSYLYSYNYKDKNFVEYLNQNQISTKAQIDNIRKIAGDDYPAESAWMGTVHHLAKLDSIKMLIPILIIGIIIGVISFTIREFGKIQVIRNILIYIIILLSIFILYSFGVLLYENIFANVVISDAYTVFEDFLLTLFTPITVIYLICILVLNHKKNHKE